MKYNAKIVPGRSISPNPNNEYGLSHSNIGDCMILGTLITIGKCSLLPLPGNKKQSITAAKR